MDALVGRSFGEFIVREPLSSGGFAQVFRAEQPALAREAVIKVLHRRHLDSDSVVQRFLREAQLASKLDHPFAAHTYAFGAEPDGVLWIAMELVRGTPLDRLLDAQGPIPLERFVPLIERICEVIHTAHEQGIVHRDLKPANVMVLARAGRLLPKLLDFGIAKDAGAVEHVPTATDTGELVGGGRLTEHGASMGSPLYMAPEQWVDAGAADARTDQYALGVLCYEALTGNPPFAGATRMAIARAHAQKPVPPLGGSLPAALDAVLARAMAKRAADRYASVLELATAFRAASGIASEPITLPRLPEAARTAALAGAPQPLADAVAALDAARNPHQARDAIWQLARVAARLVAVAALAGHAHVGSADAGAAEAVRRLSRPSLGDDEWLELARALCRPFAAIRDAHPVPELVAYVLGEAPALTSLIAMRAAAPAGASDERVRELLDRAMPACARLLAELAWLADYPLVVPDGRGEATVWMGARRDRARMRTAGLAAGEPALVDVDGVRVVSLAPFAQLLAPAPGAPEQIFLFDGKGRRGARLVALPDPFEREDEAAWTALDASMRDTDPGGAISDEERSPFPGLAAFGAGDAARFFGRERETEAFVNRLRVAPLLAVVGPSGAGKSSFVHAGVIPALPDGWRAITVRPGAAPMGALAARLEAPEVATDPAALGDVLRARGPVVLVIDQLEELFTLCDDPPARERFADALAGAARAADDPVRLVLTLRDDFLLHAAALPALRARLAPALQLLTTPAAPELRRILVEPVTRAGYDFDDPALPDDVVAALAGTPAALALLSFTGLKLWELRDRRFRQLGRKAYESLGGVGGALAQHAEDTLRAMPADEQRLVREVFRHAVTANGTRAVLSRAELDQVLGGGPHAASVVEKLVAARLLVVREGETGGERIEIAHEALLDAWPRLVTWRREDREGAKLRDQLRAAARQWDERGRPAGLLWRGDALTEYRLWRARTEGALTSIEAAFTSASLADAVRGRRLRVGLLAGAFAVLGAGVIALLFLNARATANARELHDNLERQYEDEGRRLVLAGEPLQALAYLAKAEQLGAHGRGHDLLIAQAVRATDGEELELRHDGPARSPRFSPDGTRLVTAGLDHVVKIWDARTGALLHTLHHDGNVVQARFSPDGATVATASFDHTAGLWDARTGARLRTFAHDDLVWCAQFSPDGNELVTASHDDTVKLWDVASGALRATLRGDGAGQRTCAFSADGERLAVGDEKGTTRVWNVASGALLATLHAQHSIVKAIGWSPDGARLVSASVDGTAVEYDLASATALRVFDHHLAVFDATFSPDGHRIATAANDNTAVIWDADSGARLVTLTGHAAGVATVIFTPDGARVITTSADATARLWDATSGRMLARWIGHRDMVLHASIDPSGQRLATASEDGSAMIWSMRPTEDVRVIPAHAGPSDLATFSPDGTRAVSAGRDGTIRIWDAETGGAVQVLRGHKGIVFAARYAPDGRQIASAGEDGTVRIWDAATGAPLHVLTGHRGMVLEVSWAPDGSRLASGGADGTARVWSPRDGESLFTIPAVGHFRLRTVRFTPTGAELATTAEDNTTRFYDASSGRPRAMHHFDDTPNAVAFDPTGRLAASPVANRTIRVWDVATGRTVRELVGHDATTNTAEWSPDGTMIVSTALDGTARIWDVSTGDLVATFQEGHQVLSASFSSDGTRVVMSTNDGAVAIRKIPRWHGSPHDLEQLLRCRVPFAVEDGRLIEVPRDRAACVPLMQ